MVPLPYLKNIKETNIELNRIEFILFVQNKKKYISYYTAQIAHLGDILQVLSETKNIK